MTEKAYMVNGFEMSTVGALEPDLRALIERRARVLSPAYKLFYEHPVSFVRAEGVHLYDANGLSYLDAYNNVPSVGHCHPHVVEAICRQAGTLNTHTRYATEDLLDYTERLLATMPSQLSNMLYTCSGSEAVDVALRIARGHTGATGVIVTRNAYHGTTSAAAEISPNLGPTVALGEDVRTVELPTGQFTKDGFGQALAKNVRNAIADLDRHGIGLAAFIVDSLLSTDGIIPDPAGFLAPVVEVVHSAGGVYIADEVQPGFARTGAAMWGFQRHGIMPDLVVMGKPMGNGMPIAGVASQPEILVEFGATARYFNTFAGNSVCIAAASAVLDVIEGEDLMENSRVVGEYLKDGITGVGKTSPEIGAVRGVGLYIGVEIVAPSSGAADPERAIAIVNGMRERRVLISATGPNGNVLKIRPPLSFSASNSDQFLEVLTEVLQNLR
jgi:4-aminobutyrate aminotransferase-like enzyme